MQAEYFLSMELIPEAANAAFQDKNVPLLKRMHATCTQAKNKSAIVDMINIILTGKETK